jgi:cellulose synthase/poly-beta-1,6-N-acetylglucosamine synthase-like glycosyltransferase
VTVRRAVWTIVAPFGVCVLLAGWVLMSAADFEVASFSVLVFSLANLIVYTDALDLVLRLYMHRRHTVMAREGDDMRDLSINLGVALPQGGRRVVPTAPYAIIASVFNLEDDIDAFIEAFGAYRDRVWLVSDGSTDNTVMRLRRLGWRCLDEPVNRRKPGALRALLETLPESISTIMVIDPDIRIRSTKAGSTIDLERFIGDFQLSGAAAACPRIMIEPDGFLARFQAYEYALSFRIGRNSLSDFSITSGGVSVYRRDALVLALLEHSLSVYAEDFENAVILLGAGERIYYDGRLVVSTEGPGTVRRWFSQRVGWYHGLLKVYTERFGRIWRISRRAPFAFYHFLLYIGVLSIGLHLVKVLSAVLLVASLARGLDRLLLDNWLPAGVLTNPVYFTAAVGSYLALGVIALFTSVPKSERAYVAPIVPIYLLYAIAHIVPMTVGYANWISVKLFGRRLYHDHYEPRPRGAVPDDELETNGRSIA